MSITRTQTFAAPGDTIGGAYADETLLSAWLSHDDLIDESSIAIFGLASLNTVWSGKVPTFTPAGDYSLIMRYLPAGMGAQQTDVVVGPIEITAETSTAYLTLLEATTLAGTMVPAQIPAFLNAANAAYLDMALQMASDRIDSLRYQGRKYDPAQEREFPRVPYSSGAPRGSLGPQSCSPNSLSVANTIWDWDDTTKTAVVPAKVKLACVFEADSILAGRRDRVIAAQHDGLQSQSVDGMAESYFADARTRWGGQVCMNARDLLSKYQLRTGQIQ